MRALIELMKVKPNYNKNRNDAYPPGPREIFPYSLAIKFISNRVKSDLKLYFVCHLP